MSYDYNIQSSRNALTSDIWDQWWKVTKYIYLGTLLKYNFQVLVLQYFHLMLLDTSTPLHLPDSCCRLCFYLKTYDEFIKYFAIIDEIIDHFSVDQLLQP